MSEEKISKLPNLRDGLAVSYAAADKGNNKAATRAREAAYTESNEPLVKSTGTRLLSNDTPYAPRWKSFPEIKSDNTSGSKNEGYVYKPKEEKSSGGGKTSGALSVTQEEKNTKNNVNGFKAPPPKHSIEEHKQQQGNMGNNREILKGGNSIYSGRNVSTTLDKYTPNKMLSDILYQSNDIEDIFEDFKNEDYISFVTAIMRNNPTLIFQNKSSLTELGKDVFRAIWKGGSELYLRPKGYNVSADMLEHSLQEKPKDVVFYEDSDVVKKIKEDNNFIEHLDDVVNKIENNIPLVEDKDKHHDFNDEDLFYSIHGCKMDVDDIKYNSDGTKDISVHLHDTYDYTKIWTAMDGDEFAPFKKISLGSIANDAGTISSKLDAINSYEVDIYFTIRR